VAHAARCAGCGPDTGRDRLEQGRQPLDDRCFAADHQAVAALEAPDAATCADVEVVDAFLTEPRCTRDVVTVVGVAAVDDHVSMVHQFPEGGHSLLGDLTGRDHHPDSTWLVQLFGELVE